MKWFDRETDNAQCDGYDEPGDPCQSHDVEAIGPGGEFYCSEHRNMAGSICAEKINGEWRKWI